MKGSILQVILMSFLMLQVESNPVDLSPNFLLGSLRNVTNSATRFISDSIHKQTEIILQAKNTATEYVSNAVAVPTKILITAKDATRDYIDSTASKGMEMKVKSLLDVLRAMMPYGIQALDLPVLEPLRIEHKDFEINNKEIGNISSTIENVTVSQLSTFLVDRAKLTLVEGVSLAVNLSIPTIRANGMYRVSGMFGTMFPVNGNGPFNLEAHGVRVYVHTVLGYSGAMYVKSLDIDFSIQSLNAVFHNLYRDDEVNETINEVISDLAPELLEYLKPELRPEIEEMLTQRINASVARLTMGNIIAILTGTADISSFAHVSRQQESVE